LLWMLPQVEPETVLIIPALHNQINHNKRIDRYYYP